MTDPELALLDVPRDPADTYLGRQVVAALAASGYWAVQGSLFLPYLAGCTPGAVRMSNVRVTSEMDPADLEVARQDFETLLEYLTRNSIGSITALLYGPGEIAVRHPVTPAVWPTVDGPVGSVAFQITAE